jgi:hypothetical protein
MSVRKAREIWVEQCDAAQLIKLRYGLKSAFDYVVGEKLVNFASTASQHSEFARELPKFVAEVRRMFTRDEIRTHIARLERERNEKLDDISEEDDLLPESPETVAERQRQFTTIKDFLTAAELGTS